MIYFLLQAQKKVAKKRAFLPRETSVFQAAAAHVLVRR